jgi:hypothetical protein
VQINDSMGYLPCNRVAPGIRAGTNGAYAVVTGPSLRDRLHLRADMSELSSSLGQYFCGTQVEVLAENVTGAALPQEGWSQVRVGGKVGYMRRLYLSSVRSGDPATWRIEEVRR